MSVVAEFRMGAVFKADDVVSRWLTGLCMALNDLLFDHAGMDDAVTSGQPSHAAQFYWRVSWGHYREAVKRAAPYVSDDEVKAFVAALDDEAREDYRGFVETFDPWEDSFVHAFVRRLRNSAFHYPTDDDIAYALRETVEDTVTLSLGDGARRNFRAGFADAAAAAVLLRVVDESEDESVEAMFSRLAGAVFMLVRFVEAALSKHLANAPEGSVRLADPADGVTPTGADED